MSRARAALAPTPTSSMIPEMERVTATIHEQTLAAIRRVAGPRGVSSFLEAAARERLVRLRVLGLLDELDAKYGPLSTATRRRVAKQAEHIFRSRRR